MNSSELHRLYWLFERIPQASTVVAVAVGKPLQKILMAMGLFLCAYTAIEKWRLQCANCLNCRIVSKHYPGRENAWRRMYPLGVSGLQT